MDRLFLRLNSNDSKKTSRVIIVAMLTLVVVSSAGFAVNRTVSDPLIEMKMIYEENPAFFLKDMKLIWGDTVYHVTQIKHSERGREIGYATDEYSTWRIYELKGCGQDYLLAVESEDVWRVMSIYPPQEPWKQYILENAIRKQRFERLLSVTLYHDGTARLATPPISSYMLPGCTYSFVGRELLIYSSLPEEVLGSISAEKDKDVIARFEVADDDSMVFISSSVPLFADKGARYVSTSGFVEIIERNLDIITESPAYASDVYSYINAHRAEYDEIVALSGNALHYMFAQFDKGGQHGLRGWVMAYACRDILGADSEFKPGYVDTGQDWYDAYKLFVNENQP